MGQKEEMIYHLHNSLREEIIDFFDSIERFEDRFILNSSVVKDSPFEKNKFISNININLPSDGILMEVVMGDRQEIEIDGIAKVACCHQIPKKGPELNSWSQALLSFKGIADVTFESQSKRITINKLSIH